MDESTERRVGEDLTEDARVVFDRVWRRVMTGDEESCPITWDRPGDGAVVPSAPVAPAGPEGPTPPAVPQRAADRPHSDFPRCGHVLGAGAAEHVPLLQELIRGALRDVRDYQAMARRAGGPAGRTLQVIAREERQHARALAAAHFLITGAWYWPDVGSAPGQRSYLGFLRQRFQAEQEALAAYLAAAEGTADPCLARTFLAHAQEEWDHACRIRALVEQA